MFTGSCSYMWGAAWKKAQRCLCAHISNWVTELASPMEARSLELISRGWLKRMVSQSLWFLNDWVHTKYTSPLPCFTADIFSSPLLTVYQNPFLCCELLLSAIPCFSWKWDVKLLCGHHWSVSGAPKLLYTILPISSSLLFDFTIHLCLWVTAFEYLKV